MPWRDWQFWLVSLAAAWGLWAVVRQLMPRRGSGEPSCSKCDVAAVAQEAATREPLADKKPSGSSPSASSPRSR